ncbi:FKBP-type peptidyl-prolyl cis-trans isomerase [Bifidobacterium sp. B4081]|uniref:FKBP-type peptidyl-prolyl cis-trans isomerase n=1 Tax=unclassified Bifidobacterium TaxID=2608897 RepID=UPI00226AB54F|nr:MULTISPECIES: FKBP-type peptidyl-prolyl cis-trans isomerase [unclassified Bifidobacterium]MCX8644102.1 FKBP-type peptidyl-prolyl cis-trans isomerase [Bifidobacterium sp. B4077]MCX8645190.1 FKBP-type peptidyl-prolyl cis-trans isomerase [Bifidobacterium sp. B4081]MCX8669100.1 FKBP-type peptidyl-prolyl cis-trans isomerase [Bifidobacterium sp. B3998]
MTIIVRNSRSKRLLGAMTALALFFGLSACGGKSDGGGHPGDTMQGVSASGKLGSKPDISFKTPFKVENQTHQVIQKGDGEVIRDGDRVCTRSLALDAKTGKVINSTWDKSSPECSIVISKKSIPAYYDTFKGLKVNSTVAVGIDESGSGSSSQATSSYIMALTFVSRSKNLTRAQGQKVTDLPSDLPKISLDDKGKPSLDLNGYQPKGGLVVQPLIKGKGAKVGQHQSVSANYTGWLASDGKQFDSSWDRGQASDFSLDQVVKGWQQGLAGQTVGSQVLLIVPPDLGYGSQQQQKIPANSTLIFVVDILAAY